MFVGGQRFCWRPKYPFGANGSVVGPIVVSMVLNCATRDAGPMIWIQPEFMPDSTSSSSLKVSSPFAASQRR